MLIHEVEQGTDEWHQLRAGIPTASEFSKIVTGTGKESTSLKIYAYNLAAEAFAEKKFDTFEGNQHTERGNQLEAEAAEQYGFISDIEPQEIGFITNDAMTYGCSPDRLLNDDGLLEIKCLKSDNHIETMLYYKKHNKAPSKYYPQVQGQMLVTGRNWCDLFFYHPDLPSFSVRHKKDESYIYDLKKFLDQVIEIKNETLAIIKGV